MVIGLLFIIIGLVIWLSNLGYIRIDLARDWPVILILVGAYMVLDDITRKLRSRKG